MTDKKYLFTSERLGFRNWQETDLYNMYEQLNTDKDVMEFFPSLPTQIETEAFILKMQREYYDRGHCYFAVDKLENNEFIGFIGLSEKNFKSDFTPCVDIGWRIKKSEWNKGYATEGAKACLAFGFTQLKLTQIYSMAPTVNRKSQLIMEKIGMTKIKSFIHPQLENDERLRECVLYEIKSDNTILS